MHDIYCIVFKIQSATLTNNFLPIVIVFSRQPFSHHKHHLSSHTTLTSHHKLFHDATTLSLQPPTINSPHHPPFPWRSCLRKKSLNLSLLLLFQLMYLCLHTSKSKLLLFSNCGWVAMKSWFTIRQLFM